MLEISKIEAQRATLNQSPTDLHSLFKDMYSMFHAKCEAKGIAFSLEGLSRLPARVLADEGKTRQIFINLIGNAVKFTERGHIVTRIICSQENNGDWLMQAVVEDTGPGISCTEMARLFQPFEQTATGRAAGGGTGLGLAISREFARMMSGDITLRSEVGQGSTFTVTLRFGSLTEKVPTEGKPAARHVLRLGAGAPLPKILVVDDQSDNRRLLSELLVNIGFNAISATNGAEAIVLFEKETPQAIVMDLRMPLMDGVEATRRIRALPGGDKVKILGLSASVIRDQQEPMHGVDAFMGKPFRDDDLLECLRGMLDLHYEYETSGGPHPRLPPRSRFRNPLSHRCARP
ncbi:MAG: ATP-binding protein [Nibricoccus sp.]